MPTEFLSLIPHTSGFLQYLTLYNWYICVGWRLYLPGWCSQGFWGWSRLCDVGWHVCWTHRIRGRDDRGERQEVQAVLRDELSHSHEETCRWCSRIQVQSEDHFSNFGPSICMIMWLNCGCFVGSETAILSMDVSALFIGHSLLNLHIYVLEFSSRHPAHVQIEQSHYEFSASDFCTQICKWCEFQFTMFFIC